MDNIEAIAFLLLLRRRANRKALKRLWIHPINEARNTFGEYSHLVRELRLDNSRFFQYFRMETEVFDELLRITGPDLFQIYKS